MALRRLERATFMRWTAIPALETGYLSWLQEWLRGTMRDPVQHFQKRSAKQCSCCGNRCLFASARRGGAREVRCPWCRSKPRDRHLALLLLHHEPNLAAKRILHFAPEWPLFNKLKREPLYVGADIQPRRSATAIADITAINSPQASFDVLICNHVLEHVPADADAIKECFRVLAPGGIAFFSVPIDLDKATTWEPPEGMPVEEVERICGRDHKRFYGRDFADRLQAAGFEITQELPRAGDIDQYRLTACEPMFVCRKPHSQATSEPRLC